jgi:hypothetical protein
VSLPKGAFRLNFEPFQPPEQTPVSPPRPARNVLLLSIALAIVAGWAIAATIALTRSMRTAPAVDAWTPELEALWGPFLQSHRSMVVCLGTPLFVRFPNLGFFRDPRVNDWAEIEKSERLGAARKALGVTEIIPSYNFTGAGEASRARCQATGPRKDLLLFARQHRLLAADRG